jgi:ABC-type multidrug transport system fused ATPase/permease subunit
VTALVASQVAPLGALGPTPLSIEQGGVPSAKAQARLDRLALQEAQRERKAVRKAHTKRVWELQKPERPFLVLAVLGALGVGAANPLMGVFFALLLQLFYYPEPERMLPDAWLWGALFLGLAAVQLLAELARSSGLAYVRERLTRRLRAETFEAMLRQEMGWFDFEANSAANLSANLSRDITLLSAVTGESLGLLIANVGTVLLGLAFMFALGEWRLTLIALCIVPLIGGAAAIEIMTMMGNSEGIPSEEDEQVAGVEPDAVELAKKRRKAAAELEAASKPKRRDAGREARERSSRIVGQLAASVRTVASFGLEGSLHAEFAEATGRSLRARVLMAWIPACTVGFSQFIFIVAILVVYWYGGVLVQRGKATFAQMFTVILVVFYMAFG